MKLQYKHFICARNEFDTMIAAYESTQYLCVDKFSNYYRCRLGMRSIHVLVIVDQISLLCMGSSTFRWTRAVERRLRIATCCTSAFYLHCSHLLVRIDGFNMPFFSLFAHSSFFHSTFFHFTRSPHETLYSILILLTAPTPMCNYTLRTDNR